MTSREIVVFVVDTLAWLGAGTAIVTMMLLAIQAVRRRYVYINGKKATLREEPLGFLLVVAAFAGVAYSLWPVFWHGAQTWLR